MESLSNWYFSFNPLLRGVIIAATAYLGIQIIKPAITHEEYEGQSFTKGWSMQSIPYIDEFGNESGDLQISGTYTPWWLIVLIVFIIFGLFI